MTARGKLFDFVGHSVTAAPGTGNCALGAALPQHRTFAAAGVANAAKVYYTINDGVNAETGVGTFTSPSTMSRDTVIASTAAGAKIDATVDAKIYLTAPVEVLERMVGEVVLWPGATIPLGWVYCAGQLLNRTVYAALFAVLGTTYGVGDGSTTFGVPDCRGRTVFGKDDMLGVAAGRLTAAGGITGVTLGGVGGIGTGLAVATTNMPSHAHSVDPPSTASGGESANHTHYNDFSTGLQSADHAHSSYFNTGNADTNHYHLAGALVTAAIPATDINHRHYVPVTVAGGGTGNPRHADGATQNIVSSYMIESNPHGHPAAGMGGNTSWQSDSYATNVHAHLVSGGTGGVNTNHSHLVQGSSGTISVGHTHAVDIAAVSTNSQGSGTLLASVSPGIVFNMIIYGGVY